MRELIKEAESRISEIAARTNMLSTNKYLALYESDSGITLGEIEIGWDTRTKMIAFGCSPKTEQEIQKIINTEKQYLGREFQVIR